MDDRLGSIESELGRGDDDDDGEGGRRERRMTRKVLLVKECMSNSVSVGSSLISVTRIIILSHTSVEE